LTAPALRELGPFLIQKPYSRSPRSASRLPNPETKKKDVVWFALNDDRPLFAFDVQR
jgi:hypothetical protein